VKRLDLAPQPETQQDYELTRARLLSTQAAERRLAQLRQRGTIAANTYDTLHAEIEAQSQELTENLDSLYNQNPELWKGELRSARLESLRAQRSQLFELHRREVISNEIYRQLTAEVDAQLQVLTRTPDERRAVAAGPLAEPDQSNE
jgi:ribosomal protein L19E